MIEIKPVKTHQIPEVKHLIWNVCQEIFQVTQEEVIQHYDDLADLDAIESNYFRNSGIFLVVCDRNKVIGSGGIKRFDRTICELKRMWFLKEYRGRGYAEQMSFLLFKFARKANYKRVRLDVFSSDKQARAINFYQKLGFYNITRYFPRDGNGFIDSTVFMEKKL